MVPNPAPIGTGSFISHQRILDPPEITIFARSSITRGRTAQEEKDRGHHHDEDKHGLDDDCGDAEVDGDGDDVAEIIHQERFWGQKRRTGDAGTEGMREGGQGEEEGAKVRREKQEGEKMGSMRCWVEENAGDRIIHQWV